MKNEQNTPARATLAPTEAYRALMDTRTLAELRAALVTCEAAQEAAHSVPDILRLALPGIDRAGEELQGAIAMLKSEISGRGASLRAGCGIVSVTVGGTVHAGCE